MSRFAKRVARALLRRAAGKSVWGQAILAELEEVDGTWAVIRWTAGGLRVSWRQRQTPARRVIAATAAAAAIAVLANQLALGVRYVPSGAMEPTVHVSDRVIIDKVGFRLTGPGHGDLFVLSLSGMDGRRFSLVSRLIGLPGDRIECRDGVVFRNGSSLSEPYLAAGTKTECTPHVVADGTVYVMGDHREVAGDSRRYGPAPIDDLVGRVFVVL